MKTVIKRCIESSLKRIARAHLAQPGLGRPALECFWIFVRGPAHAFVMSGRGLNRFQFGVAEHQPLAAFTGEIHLHAGLRASAFEVEDYAFTEQAVTYRLAEAEFGFRDLAAGEQAAARCACAAT